jgi:hypothetical protein
MLSGHFSSQPRLLIACCLCRLDDKTDLALPPWQGERARSAKGGTPLPCMFPDRLIRPLLQACLRRPQWPARAGHAMANVGALTMYPCR